MKVRDLIEALRRFDGDDLVFAGTVNERTEGRVLRVEQCVKNLGMTNEKVVLLHADIEDVEEEHDHEEHDHGVGCLDCEDLIEQGRDEVRDAVRDAL